MAKLIFLGTSNAIPTENHQNTHMVLVGKERTVMIDCVGTPIVRLKRAGVDFNTLTDLILTHFHPDHVSGVPLLLMDMWLLGRKAPLNVYGLHHTLDCIESLMNFYGWENWPHFFPIAFYRLPENDMSLLMQSQEFRIYSSPVQHFVPTIGLRVEMPELGKVLAYSCDTEPNANVVQLAANADWLIHESAGATHGHSSASQAGAIAAESGAKKLYLIHYPSGEFAEPDLKEQAETTFDGQVTVAQDFMIVDLSE